MQIKIEQSWKAKLAAEFEKPYFKVLSDFVINEYQRFICYPPENQIFAAFEHTSFNDVKVVIIGQDPYHGAGQANGLCFSFTKQHQNDKLPASLKMIYKEIKEDLGIETPQDGNLKKWADQGVLLLNSTLTVREKQANSHKNFGWSIFTDTVIKIISKEKENIVFLLWGNFARSKRILIDDSKHFILEAGHPAPPGCYKYWFGNKHFSKTNAYLEQTGQKAIAW